jgi:hypothetical protein
VIPLFDFSGPCIPCHSQWGDNQYFADEEAVKRKVEDGGKGNNAFSKTHIQKYR